MIDFLKQFQRVNVGSDYNEGLRRYMISVYNYMAGALGITAITSLIASSSPTIMKLIYGTPLRWLLFFAPLIFVVTLGAKIKTMDFRKAQVCFWVFSGVMGLSLSGLFIVYTGTSIVRSFFITSVLFISMSIYGATTKKDLSSIGSIMIMGVWSLVSVSMCNVFFKSTPIQFAVSLVGIVIFTLLTAYDAQLLKSIYYSGSNDYESKNKLALIGALNLYFDFINIFIKLLYIIGDRRD